MTSPRTSGVDEPQRSRSTPPERADATAERIRHALTETSEPLLASLFARHRESCSEHPLLVDPWSSELVTRLGLDSRRFARSSRTTHLTTAACTTFVDQAVRDFAARVSDPIVTTLGAGLCTRYLRCGLPRVCWYDVDLPNVAALRRELLPEHECRTVLAASLFDPRWMDEVAKSGPRPHETLFVAEGLLPFLDRSDARALLIRLAERFPGAEIVADLYGRDAVDRSVILRRSGPFVRWGVDDIAEIAAWDARLELLAAHDVLPRQSETRRRLRLLGPRGLLTARRNEHRLGRFRFVDR